MSDDGELLSARERARLRSRDRKIRGPRMIVDNPGLKKLTVDLANRRRRAQQAAKKVAKKARPTTRRTRG
jgi:hypothetical protein